MDHSMVGCQITCAAGLRCLDGMCGEPPTACEPLRNPATDIRGAIVLVYRCPDVDFIDKVSRAEAAGAAGPLRDVRADSLLRNVEASSRIKVARRLGTVGALVRGDAAEWSMGATTVVVHCGLCACMHMQSLSLLVSMHMHRCAHVHNVRASTQFMWACTR